MNIGDKFQHKTIKGLSIEILDTTNRGYKVKEMNANGTTKQRKGVIKYYHKNDMIWYEPVKQEQLILY